MANNIIFKTSLMRGAQGARGEAGQADAIPKNAVVGYEGSDTPDGFVEIDKTEAFDDIYTDLTVLSERIDSIEALPDGSTTADAELRDIRIGADGTVYPSAGDAVRAQIENIPKLITPWTELVGYSPDYMVTHGGKLYRNKTNSMAISSEWQGASVWEEITLNSAIDKAFTNMVSWYDSDNIYNFNDFCIHNRELMRCISQTPVTGNYDSSKWVKTSILSYIKYFVLENFTETRFSTSTAELIEYPKGTIALYRDKLYLAVHDTESGTFNPSYWQQVTLETLIKGINNTLEDHEERITNNTLTGEASGDFVTITDGGDNMKLDKCVVDINPIQDLHGYDSPWVGGAGKNKSEKKITEFSYNNNSGGSCTTDGDTLLVTAATTNNSGVYAYMSFVENYTSACSYSVDMKASSNVSVLVGMTNAGRKLVDLTTAWQRVTFENITFDGQEKIFCIYGQGDASTISLKNFMFEVGSVAHDYEPYSNICPISEHNEVNFSVLGVNLWDEETEVVSDVICSKNYIPVRPNTQYYFTPHQGRDYICFDRYYNVIKDWTWLTPSDTILTTPSNCYYIKFRMTSGYGTTYNHDISINYPSTNTGYIAYNGRVYNIPLVTQLDPPSEVSCYGGKLDVVSGVLTVDRVMVTYDGSSDENWLSYAYGYYIYCEDMKSGTDLDGLCNMLTQQSSINRLGFKLGSNNKYIYINQVQNEWGISNVSELRSFLSEKNLQIVYPLATPQTIQLTSTEIKSLLGVNNIFADTGEIDIIYKKDANIVINSLIARIEALEG
ncbi:MAG: hypothetical protein IJ938_03525 [Clostridia bacterium]|nr:hypothetical protein [Clostridia bacterium]